MAGTKRTRATVVKKAAPASNEYLSDDGFNASDDDAPASKKSKSAATKAKPAAKSGPKPAGEEKFHELSTGKTPRRVNVSEYKGKPLVNIREYYEKDGELLPGKKVPDQANLTDLFPQLEMLRDALQGISLTTEQFKELLKTLPDIKRALDLEDGDGEDEADNGAKKTTEEDDLKLTDKEKATVRLQRKHPNTFALGYNKRIYFVDDSVKEQFLQEWEDGTGEFLKQFEATEYGEERDGPKEQYEAIVDWDYDTGEEEEEQVKPKKIAPKDKAPAKAKAAPKVKAVTKDKTKKDLHPDTFVIEFRDELYFIPNALKADFNMEDNGVGVFLDDHEEEIEEYDEELDGPRDLYNPTDSWD